MGDPEDAATLQAELVELARTLEQSPSATIVPDRAPTTAERNAASAFARVDRDAALDQRLSLGATLGEGGMGIVYEAEQRSLHRQVAVKTLKSDVASGDAATKLLREAWVTGALEHPNVVPVHDLGTDDAGRPLLVLKRIEGTEWAALLRDGDEVRRRFGESDLLEFNLSTLIQVCNAVHFAHSRGVVHRDLKPENVMVGSFGEVYLVDWGIAVGLPGPTKIPGLSEATDVAGTPHYMAPEMLSGRDISERTDVYLLGAVLYEICHGRPPHDATTLLAAMASAARSEPQLSDDVPEELAAIVRKAMARDPDDRYASADDVRLAIQDFLRHRGATRLSDEAEDRLHKLRNYAQAGAGADDAMRERLYGLFSECRFGFRAALDAWPEHPTAAEGLRQAAVAMIGVELDQGEPRAAAALAAQTDRVPAEIEARIQEAIRSHEAKEAQRDALARLGRGRDPNVGRRTRMLLLLTLGVLFALAPLVGVFAPEDSASWGTAFLWPAITLAIIAVAAIWTGRVMLSTQFNRVVSLAIVVAMVGQMLLHAGSAQIGLTVEQSQVYHLLVWCVVSAVATVALDWRLVPAPLAYAIGFVIAAGHPELRYHSMAAGTSILMITGFFLWRRRSGEPAE